MDTSKATPRHLLCYCDSLPGSLCDFCSGLRQGTIDDYKSTLEWYRRSHDRLQRVEKKAKEAAELVLMMVNPGIEDLPEYRHIGPNIERAARELLREIGG